MNERIKQILLQVVPMAGEDGEYLPSLHTPEDIEKFAELIVQKCAKVANLAEENKCEWIGGNILTHFGFVDYFEKGVGIQEMTGCTGQIFKLKVRYSDDVSLAKLNKPFGVSE
jgi:hypothetical protein